MAMPYIRARQEPISTVEAKTPMDFVDAVKNRFFDQTITWQAWEQYKKPEGDSGYEISVEEQKGRFGQDFGRPVTQTEAEYLYDRQRRDENFDAYSAENPTLGIAATVLGGYVLDPLIIILVIILIRAKFKQAKSSTKKLEIRAANRALSNTYTFDHRSK